MAGALLQEQSFLGGYWVKYWPRVNGLWELRDSEGLRETFDTESEMMKCLSEVTQKYLDSPRYRTAFEQKFGTD